MPVTINGTTGIEPLIQNGNNISAVNSLGFRNRIINGDMRIDQRYAGASVANTGNPYSVDRWQAVGNQAAKYTIQQSSIAPTGFSNSVVVTSSSAYTLGAGDFFYVRQQIEGYNVADFNLGTANASTFTLSFWVRSSLTVTFGATFSNGASDSIYPFTYSISSANTWEQKTIIVTGRTSGTWNITNGTGLYVLFALGTGSTYSGTANAWTSSLALGVTGQTSVVSASGATFYITGVQLEAGTVATPFERRDYGRELMMCQRYFNKINSSGVLAGIATYTAPNTATMNVIMPVTPRATPSISYTGNLVVIGNGTSITMSGSAGSIGTATPAYVQFTLTATGIVANVPHIFYVSSGTVDFSSEL